MQEEKNNMKRTIEDLRTLQALPLQVKIKKTENRKQNTGVY